MRLEESMKKCPCRSAVLDWLQFESFWEIAISMCVVGSIMVASVVKNETCNFKLNLQNLIFWKMHVANLEITVVITLNSGFEEQGFY